MATNLLVVGDSVSVATQWPQYIPSRYVVENAAGGGATTFAYVNNAAPVVDKLNDVVMTPDVITVYLGINDSAISGQNSTPTEFKDLTDSLIDDELLTRWPNADICLILNGPQYGRVDTRDDVNYQYRAKYMQIAEERKLRIPVVDLLGDVVFGDPWTSDNTHPDDPVTMQRIATAIASSIDRAYYPERPYFQDVLEYQVYDVRVGVPYSGTEVNSGSTGGATVTHTLDYARHRLILYNDGAQDLDYRFSTTDDWKTLEAGDPPVEVPTRHAQVILDAAANDVAYRAISIG